MTPWPTITTPRLRLRPAQRDDLPAIELAIADPRFPTDLPLARMHRQARLAAWLERMAQAQPTTTLWAITGHRDDACIGTVSLTPLQAQGCWWLAYWLAPIHWQQGFATEAVGALLNAAAAQEGYRRIIAAVAKHNAPSLRVLERLGFVGLSADQISTDESLPAVPLDHRVYGVRLKVSTKSADIDTNGKLEPTQPI